MAISNIVEAMTDSLNSVNLPAMVLPPLLIRCVGLTRPGLSAYKISTEVIQNCEKLGIPTAENPDGSENLNNAYTYAIVKSIIDAIHNDAVIQGVAPLGSLKIQSIGQGPSGPIVSNGSNIIDSSITGIIM